jgi:hypothetical protein
MGATTARNAGTTARDSAELGAVGRRWGAGGGVNRCLRSQSPGLKAEVAQPVLAEEGGTQPSSPTQSPPETAVQPSTPPATPPGDLGEVVQLVLAEGEELDPGRRRHPHRQLRPARCRRQRRHRRLQPVPLILRRSVGRGGGEGNTFAIYKPRGQNFSRHSRFEAVPPVL